MRSIGVVTTSRADYGPCLPILRKIQSDPDLDLHLIVSGMHLSPGFGYTLGAIEQDGFDIDDRVEMLLSSDSPEGVAKSMGLGTMGFAQSFGKFRPDILLVVGDRFEMHSAVVSALPFKIPVAHVAGGEITEGAIDDSLRHSMTKLSHLHFVATEQYRDRILQMGEEPWRVVISGAPGLDSLHSIDLLKPAELLTRFGLAMDPPPLLVTFHPVTLEHEDTEYQIRELLAALEASGMPIVFTMPNADTRNGVVTRIIDDFVRSKTSAHLVENLGTQAYFSLMTYAAAMVGNSSSGIIEAASFELPVVNIGMRQKGRIRAKNVLDVGYDRAEVAQGIKQAASQEFRDSLRWLNNPYGDGHASDRITDKLKEVRIDQQLLMKRFHAPEPQAAAGSR